MVFARDPCCFLYRQDTDDRVIARLLVGTGAVLEGRKTRDSRQSPQRQLTHAHE